MKSVIQWAVRNGPAMNTMMAAVLIIGAVSMSRLHREVFPEFELEIILVTVPYPGASPEEVEDGICQKIEEAVRSIDGIKKQTSVAREGAGFLVLELDAGSNVQKILNEVRSEIDGIPSFPDLAEDAEVKPITFRVPAIRVGVIAQHSDDPHAAIRLREMAERVREDLLELPNVSQANVLNALDFQIDIEISEDTLRKHGLSLQQVAQIVRRQNLELPGGSIKSEGQEVLLRGKNKQVRGPEIAKIPVLKQAGGDVITLAELGQVKDEFVDQTAINEINGRPGLVVSVDRTKAEDLLAMAAEVRDYVASRQLPGYELTFWADQSVDVKDRMDMLIRNGLQGLALVFILLAIFLDLKLAFWVALGIPISILGAGGVLLASGQTLNMLSMFAFLMALGIVVDDAIVIGENIYKHREMGKGTMRAAIDGTYQVLPSVAASVCTTIIAFIPLMFVSGVMGKFIAVMPLAVIAMLVISLLESTFVLPCHLGHRDGFVLKLFAFVFYPFRAVKRLFVWLNAVSARWLDYTIERWYIPSLSWSLQNPGIVITASLTTLILFLGFFRAGLVSFVLFPKLDVRIVEAKVVFPDGTPAAVTNAATARLEESILEVDAAYRDQNDGKSAIDVRHRVVGWMAAAQNAAGIGGDTSGSHLGSVSVELISPDDREMHSDQFLDEWRRIWESKYADQFPGAESITFVSQEMGPGGKPIEFKLLAPATAEGVRQLEVAVEETKKQLASYSGVVDVDDDSRPGKWEYQLKLKPSAESLGVTLADLAETVRAAFYGEEVMRLQRGRHEVKLMVRYPQSERRSLSALQEIRVRTSDGHERPLLELADIDVERGYSEINRIDQQRSITISAEVNAAKGGNARRVVTDLRDNFMGGVQQRYPLVNVRWEGQQEQTQESFNSLLLGFIVAVLAMYALLTIEFRSYAQPLIILFIIPFGLIGAILGHTLMGIEFTLFSVFGMVALTGVVVNDSIVLIDFINHELQEDVPLIAALIEAGRRRFRPVLLTSITTVGGLTPMLLETSMQAQVLIPMATSLCFGLLAATLLVLILVPVFYSLYARVIVREALMPSDLDEAPATVPQPPLEEVVPV